MKNLPIIMGFAKYQAQGNSYIFFDFLDNEVPSVDLSLLADIVSDKNIGIGSDGMVALFPDEEADALMRIWNADGSEAELCGSALRCVTTILYRKSKVKKEEFRIKTAVGTYTGKIISLETGYQVSVHLSGLRSSHNSTGEEMESLLEIDNWIGMKVTVGNPHFVLFERLQPSDARIEDSNLLHQLSKEIGNNRMFSDGINIEFAKVIDKKKVVVRVLERGSGETLACGTGACAVVYSGIALGFLDHEAEVMFPGGRVRVRFDDSLEQCDLIGEVVLVCEGKYAYMEDIHAQ